MGHRQNKQVVFIASCGHSGSTILEFLLTSDPSCIGIGEAFQLVDPRNQILNHVHRYQCACGESIALCDFWGPVIENLKHQQDKLPEDKYHDILEHAFHTIGPGATIIDSSKVTRALDVLSRLADTDVKVIHLIRDVRSYCLSIIEAYRRNSDSSSPGSGRNIRPGGLAQFLKRNACYIFWDWYRTNLRISSTVERLNLPTSTVSYEEFCLHTASVLDSLNRFLDLKIHPHQMDAEGTKNHNVFGNRLRHDLLKRKTIQYDSKWIGRKDWMLPSIRLPRVMPIINRPYTATQTAIEFGLDLS